LAEVLLAEEDSQGRAFLRELELRQALVSARFGDALIEDGAGGGVLSEEFDHLGFDGAEILGDLRQCVLDGAERCEALLGLRGIGERSFATGRHANSGHAVESFPARGGGEPISRP
jgi:hypothetical protein